MSITVFLADDHVVLRDGLQFMLQAQADIEVVGVAADGLAAVRRVTELCPDIAILDIVMPELNGIDAAQRIIEECPQTRVIILSMYSNSEHVFRALRAGVRGYLLKETAGDEVITAVRAVHAGRRYLSYDISDGIIDQYLQQTEEMAEQSPLARLSDSERQVMKLIVEGKSYTEIAEILSLSPKTVETYRGRLMQKLGLNNLPELVKFAIQHGVTALE